MVSSNNFDLIRVICLHTILGFQFRGVRGVMVISVLRETMTCVQILDEAYCIVHNANILGKGMNPTILSPAMTK